MSTAVLETCNVSKDYNGHPALDHVDLRIPQGETLVMIGESGSGKSTLLRLFNRLIEPSHGEVRIGGRPARELDPYALRRSTGYVQQEGGLLPHWPVARNIELVPMLLGWDHPRRRSRSDALLEWVGLAPDRFRHRYPRELSGGQRQRVAIARALAADPPVILLDEPFGALDALTRLELQVEFARLRTQLDKTMVLVTHDLDEAFRLADRIAVLQDGAIQQVAAPEVLEQQPANDYVRSLLGRRGGGGEAGP